MAANTNSSGNAAVGNSAAASNGSRYIRAILHDGTTAREAFYILTSSAALSNANLSQVRGFVASSPEQQEFAMLSFCSSNGAIVPDHVMLADYQGKILRVANDATASVLDVYLKKSTDTLAAPSGNPSTYTPDPIALSRLKEAFDDNAFKVITGTAAKYTAELEEQDWSIISENNALCYGTKLARKTMTTTTPKDGKNKSEKKILLTGVERAKYPAFRMKQRSILSDRLVNTSVRDLRMYLRIPDYIVDDQSYVTMYETSTNFQASLALSSFSETDVSASVSGSAFGYDAEATASYKSSAEVSSTATTTKASKQIILAYNFPRATVLLDEDSIELTAHCERDLQDVSNLATLTKFLDKYGEFYSQRVQLGGRLFTSEEVDDSSDESTKTMKKAMKAAASASFSGPFISGSASASHAADSSRNAATANSNSLHSQTWQANGGDTLLCNDPPAWAASVAYHWNWRVTMRDDVCHIIDIIAKLPAWGHLPTTLAKWKEDATPPKPVIPQLFFLNQEGNEDGRYLVACDRNTKNLKAAAALFDKNNDSQQSIPIPAKYETIGAVLLGPKAKIRQPDDLALQLETTEGGHVDDPCYNTEYRLRSTSSKLYISFDVLKRGGTKDTFFKRQEWKFLCTSETKGAILAFRDPSDTSKKSAIPDKAVVWMYLKEKPYDSLNKWVCTCSDPDEYVALELDRETWREKTKFVFTKKSS